MEQFPSSSTTIFLDPNVLSRRLSITKTRQFDKSHPPPLAPKNTRQTNFTRHTHTHIRSFRNSNSTGPLHPRPRPRLRALPWHQTGRQSRPHRRNPQDPFPALFGKTRGARVRSRERCCCYRCGGTVQGRCRFPPRARSRCKGLRRDLRPRFSLPLRPAAKGSEWMSGCIRPTGTESR